LQKYTDITTLNLDNFKHIIAGAFFQMKADYLQRLGEIKQLITGNILFIDVVPADIHQQLILCDKEREMLLSQLGAANYICISDKYWPEMLRSIRANQNCKKGIYEGPHMVSGLTEEGIDHSQTKSFLVKFFQNITRFDWHKELGYYYPLLGKVVYGNQIGRTLGFPTLNIEPIDARKLIPPMGVYTGLVKYRSKWMKCMINIGIRPTLDMRKVTIEAHVFDFSEEIYGDMAVLHFTDRLRDEMRFDNLDMLKSQLKADKKKAIRLLKDIDSAALSNNDFILTT
jgi:hypothetical protein